MFEFLSGKSVEELLQISAEARKLAEDLRGKKPSYRLAILGGVKDASYKSAREGIIACFRGTAEITLEDGSRWRAVGHGPKGDAWSVTRHGWIEFIPLG